MNRAKRVNSPYGDIFEECGNIIPVQNDRITTIEIWSIGSHLDVKRIFPVNLQFVAVDLERLPTMANEDLDIEVHDFTDVDSEATDLGNCINCTGMSAGTHGKDKGYRLTASRMSSEDSARGDRRKVDDTSCFQILFVNNYIVEEFIVWAEVRDLTHKSIATLLVVSGEVTLFDPLM